MAYRRIVPKSEVTFEREVELESPFLRRVSRSYWGRKIHAVVGNGIPVLGKYSPHRQPIENPTNPIFARGFDITACGKVIIADPHALENEPLVRYYVNNKERIKTEEEIAVFFGEKYVEIEETQYCKACAKHLPFETAFEGAVRRYEQILAESAEAEKQRWQKFYARMTADSSVYHLVELWHGDLTGAFIKLRNALKTSLRSWRYNRKRVRKLKEEGKI